jgi:hypothetical protein
VRQCEFFTKYIQELFFYKRNTTVVDVRPLATEALGRQAEIDISNMASNFPGYSTLMFLLYKLPSLIYRYE